MPLVWAMGIAMAFLAMVTGREVEMDSPANRRILRFKSSEAAVAINSVKNPF